MASKKRTTKDEKRTLLIELLHEKKEPLTKEEFENLGAKKGVVRQAVLDVVKELVDDNEIQTDKIGTAVFFWSFPSDSASKKQVQLDTLKKNIATAKSKISEIEKENVASKSGRQDSADRTAKLETLLKMKQENEQLKQELQKYAENDPALLDAMKMDIDMAVEATNRWTDNIFTIKQWATNKFPGIDSTQFNKNFHIPEEFDYLEAPKI